MPDLLDTNLIFSDDPVSKQISDKHPKHIINYKTRAIHQDIVLHDPTLLEEKASDHIITDISINDEEFVFFSSKEGISIDKFNDLSTVDLTISLK